MSIIHSFDKKSEPIITAKDSLPKSNFSLAVCIINFSYKVMEALIEKGLLEELDLPLKTVANVYPVYKFKGSDIGVIKPGIGAVAVAGVVEELSYMYSCKKFVMYGSCGGLDKSISPNLIIVPTFAYRDEGISYHYAPANDYIEIKNSNKVAQILKANKVEFVFGKTWTTDAFYRETKNNLEKRKADGCIAVEMEVSAMQAVCDFYGYEFYNFLYRADNLDSNKWERSILGLITIDDRLKNFAIALEVAKAVK